MRANWTVALGAIGLAAAALAIGVNGQHQPPARDRPDETFSITSSTTQTAVDEGSSMASFTFHLVTAPPSSPFGFFERR